MGIHRLKSTFTAGEISPLMSNRSDFERYGSGCRILRNAFCLTQGPARRRSGFEFIYDLTSLGLDLNKPEVRMIPFIFNELQSYVLVFYHHTDGRVRMVICTREGGLMVYPNPIPPGFECPPGTPQTPTPGDIVYLQMPVDFNPRTFDWAQSADEMYIAQNEVAPFTITRWGHHCWTTEALVFVATPPDWANSDYPERVTFHQQRLVYAANRIRRQTVWTSKAGDFLNFTSVANEDDSAITFTLDSGTQNKIQWLLSGKALSIGTLGNEWIVSGNDRDALTPSNVKAARETNNGSEPITPLLIGLATLFVEKHGRTVNEFLYDFNYDSYKNADVTILAPHLTDYYSIIDWTYQQTPDGILWCVREDGILNALTYQRDHKVMGWHTHDTDGLFRAITCIPGTTREDDVWTVVNRNIDGDAKMYIERMADQFKGTKASQGEFLDSWIEYSGVSESIMAGLEHLEGKEVHILANGTVHPTRIVQNGQITLDNEYTEVLVGLQYITEIRPYLKEIPTKTGNTVGRMQRVINVDVNLYKSLGMVIGRDDQVDGEYDEEIPFRVPGDLTGQEVPLFTGIRHLDFPEGYDRNIEYYIRQEQPLPLTVLGVVDTFEVME